MFEPGERSADRIDGAAERLAQLDTFPPLVRDGVARVLRVAAVELRKGRPLPMRLDDALDDLVAAIDTETTTEHQYAPDWP